MTNEELISMLTGTPLAPKQTRASVLANPFASIMSQAERQADAISRAGLAANDIGRSLFGLEPRELTNAEKFTQQINAFDRSTLGTDEGNDQLLQIYSLIDPIGAFEARNKLDQQQFNNETQSLRNAIDILGIQNDMLETQQRQDALIQTEAEKTGLKNNIVAMLPEDFRKTDQGKNIVNIITNSQSSVSGNLDLVQRTLKSLDVEGEKVSNVRVMVAPNGDTELIGLNENNQIVRLSGDGELTAITNFGDYRANRKDPKEPKPDRLPVVAGQNLENYRSIFRKNKYGADKSLKKALGHTKFGSISPSDPEVTEMISQAELLRTTSQDPISFQDALQIIVNQRKQILQSPIPTQTNSRSEQINQALKNIDPQG